MKAFMELIVSILHLRRLIEMSLQELVAKKLQLESKWATQALSKGRVTPDMKWIDIKLKDVKVKINEQSVIDAKVDLLQKAG